MKRLFFFFLSVFLLFTLNLSAFLWDYTEYGVRKFLYDNGTGVIKVSFNKETAPDICDFTGDRNPMIRFVVKKEGDITFNFDFVLDHIEKYEDKNLVDGIKLFLNILRESNNYYGYPDSKEIPNKFVIPFNNPHLSFTAHFKKGTYMIRLSYFFHYTQEDHDYKVESKVKDACDDIEDALWNDYSSDQKLLTLTMYLKNGLVLGDGNCKGIDDFYECGSEEQCINAGGVMDYTIFRCHKNFNNQDYENEDDSNNQIDENIENQNEQQQGSDYMTGYNAGIKWCAEHISECLKKVKNQNTEDLIKNECLQNKEKCAKALKEVGYELIPADVVYHYNPAEDKTLSKACGLMNLDNLDFYVKNFVFMKNGEILKENFSVWGHFKYIGYDNKYKGHIWILKDYGNY